MANEEQDVRDAIARQLSKIEEGVKWSAQGQMEAAKVWRAVNLWVGVPTALLAAAAGVTAPASTASRTIAGITAVAAGAYALHPARTASNVTGQNRAVATEGPHSRRGSLGVGRSPFLQRIRCR